MRNVRKGLNALIILFFFCGLIMAGNLQQKTSLQMAVTQSAYMEVPGVTGQIKVLGIACGNTTPVAGQYSNALTKPGVNQLKMLFDTKDKLATSALSLNKMYSQGTLVLNYAGLPPVRYKLINMAVKQVDEGNDQHPGSLAMPKTTTAKPPVPVTSGPPKPFAVTLAVSRIQLEIPTKESKKGPLKKKY